MLSANSQTGQPSLQPLLFSSTFTSPLVLRCAFAAGNSATSWAKQQRDNLDDLNDHVSTMKSICEIFQTELHLQSAINLLQPSGNTLLCMKNVLSHVASCSGLEIHAAGWRWEETLRHTYTTRICRIGPLDSGVQSTKLR